MIDTYPCLVSVFVKQGYRSRMTETLLSFYFTTGNNKTPANINSYRRSETKLLQFGDISPSSVKDDDHFVFRTPYTRGPPGDAISTRKQHLPSTNLTDMLPYAEKTICKLLRMTH